MDSIITISSCLAIGVLIVFLAYPVIKNYYFRIKMQSLIKIQDQLSQFEREIERIEKSEPDDCLHDFLRLKQEWQEFRAKNLNGVGTKGYIPLGIKIIDALNDFPDSLGRFIGYLLPKRIRERVFEPVFEELKEDRLETMTRYQMPLLHIVLGFAFGFRICTAYCQSLLCWICIPFEKIAPIFRAFFR